MTKNELKFFLESLGIVVTGNYIKKQDVKKVLATAPVIDIKTGKKQVPSEKLKKLKSILWITGVGEDCKFRLLPTREIINCDQFFKDVREAWDKFMNTKLRNKYKWDDLEITHETPVGFQLYKLTAPRHRSRSGKRPNPA